jgi:arsenate reductase (thioredoxin)
MITTSKTLLHPALAAYVREQVLPLVAHIPAERRLELARIAAYVSQQHAVGRPAALVFICTHNSRRSQLGQVWAATAAAWLGVRGVQTYSGGTEVTAFDVRAVQALRRAGFQVEADEGDNPRYAVSMGPGGAPLPCWSKVYDDEANPREGFAAIMTCSAADAACPTVRGAALRVALPYDDPKYADDTPEEAARYDARSRQIAAEMLFVCSQVKAEKA